MENNLQKPGLEQTILNLLEEQSKYGVDNINMLLMLSLVNLMGIVDILQRAIGGRDLGVEISQNSNSAAEQDTSPNQSRQKGAPDDDLMRLVQQAASGSLNPDQLIAALSRSGHINPALLTMLTQMMPPPPPEPRQASQKAAPKPNIEQHSKENTGSAAETDSEEDWGKKGTAQKNILKWDPRLG